jgi:hypothetical protein
MANDPLATPPETVATAQPGSHKTAIIIAVVLGGILLVALLLPAMTSAPKASRVEQASNHLKWLGLAFQNYHAAYQQLPLPAGTSASGKPLWSWRVALLPFMEEQATWERWQQDDAWNSRANSPLLVPMPAAYRSPADAGPNTDQTHIFAVRHPRSMMSGESTLAFEDVSDGLPETILAVWLPHRTTSWAAPEDITVSELQTEFAKLSSPDTILLLMGDGAVQRIKRPLDDKTIEAMVTRDAGDEVGVLP